MTGHIFIGIATDLSSWRVALGLLGILTVICSTPMNYKKKVLHVRSMWNAYTIHFKNKQLVATILLWFTLMGGLSLVLLTRKEYHMEQHKSN
ncbi:sugar transporter [Bacillus pseudomycoides]|uniref:sugar transporter n=1 Tax=Bacillus pseudomycoides TaxID=64104 RepID=UPI0011A3219E|nr:sugar transporter [Bacillus pseudomycoides]